MEACQRCHKIDEDRRTIWMACFYDMDELRIPLKSEVIQSHIQDPGKQFYTMRVCKDCRADWLIAIKEWFNATPKVREGCGSGIFVREFGAIKEIPDDEWYLANPGIEPCRFKEDKDK